MSSQRHKVVTYERGGGFAARCTCGDLTFGGYGSRTEARAALLHENAPATVAADRGFDQLNNQRGSEKIMTIIPDTDEARQTIRVWATDLAAAYAEHGDDLEVPTWPVTLTPWWADSVTVEFFGGGEATVELRRDCGDANVSTLVTVVVSDAPGWSANHPGKGVGDFFELETGAEITISGPHEGMSLTDAAAVFDSLALATSLLRRIENGAAA